ncbi:hypothetical protein AJ80_06506 [Polytolypa hystricis UAMH7299]|uniref:LEM-like domain-containing protein n=1 Tax=Polytolypa hystricis (strain UAMH7299) TaxID=1447883 RepID=A0A2B7XWM0_POLH7|nr:hypothetical protein AJ80_06506 [Polytolypa hystricis UAMH7299]
MASDSENGDLAYLDPDFDLSSLTVPRIRSILVSHDVPYPASAKKSQLIDILRAEILPQAKKLLRERERVRRTSKGITNMPSSQETDDDDVVEVARAPVTPGTLRRGRSRPSTRASTAETWATEDSSVKSGTASSRRRTMKHPRAEDTETDVSAIDATPRRSSRKVRKSEAFPTPRASTADHEDLPSPVKRETRESSIFTDDNPFQSGSSPIEKLTPRARTISVEHNTRRKSSGRHSVEVSATEERRKRKTEPLSSRVKQEENFVVPTRSTFEIPRASRSLTPKIEESEEEEDEIEAGEEFTPEEEQELAEEAVEGGKRDSAIRRRQTKSQGRAGRFASWLVIFTLVGGFAAWWRKEKVEIGYCGIGKPHWSLDDTKVPEWASILEPQCEPCPQHAFCYSNFEARCEKDFVLQHHPLSLNGLIPLPPSCEADSEKSRRVKSVAQKAIAALRERKAKWECGEIGKNGEEVESADMTAAELRAEIAKQKRKGMTEEEFEELWKGAIGEITGREEIITSTRGPSSSPTNTYASTSLARLSLSCALRRHIRHTIFAYRFPLLLLILSAVFTVYIRSRLRAARSDAARVPALVAMTLDRLATQAALHARGEAPEAWVSIGQLRDDVLRDELRGSRREKLWKLVRGVVEGNANVRASVREGRGGDVSRVWEWIGVIGGAGEWDGGSNSNSARRESARVRFSLSSPGGGVGETETGAGGNVEEAREGGKREMRRWTERRPAY